LFPNRFVSNRFVFMLLIISEKAPAYQWQPTLFFERRRLLENRILPWLPRYIHGFYLIHGQQVVGFQHLIGQRVQGIVDIKAPLNGFIRIPGTVSGFQQIPVGQMGHPAFQREPCIQIQMIDIQALEVELSIRRRAGIIGVRLLTGPEFRHAGGKRRQAFGFAEQKRFMIV
jgi:hypothetical protein